jgi:hypothetical protein
VGSLTRDKICSLVRPALAIATPWPVQSTPIDAGWRQIKQFAMLP